MASTSAVNYGKKNQITRIVRICNLIARLRSDETLKKYMTVGKLFEFASKPEHPGLSSLIRLEAMMD